MISVAQAKVLIDENVAQVRSCVQRCETMPLASALGRILAQAVVAPISLPFFDNSAMDGFAVRSHETQAAGPSGSLFFAVMQETQAGDPPAQLSPGPVAVRIMTGAPLPVGADAVIKKEDVLEIGKIVRIAKPVSVGDNVRYRGEEIQEDDLAVAAQTCITPGVIGFLASLGISSVSVIAPPRLSLLVTGQELVTSRDKLQPGKILDANTPMLKALLKEMGISCVIEKALPDDPQKIKKEIAAALEVSDILILTGGVSVGDHDHTRSVLQQLGVQEIFWKVAQKPGKPLYVGRIQNKMVFGLPGNPYSTFACFCVYVRPALRILAGYADKEHNRRQLKTSKSIRLDESRAQFLKAKLVSKNGFEQVEPLTGQGSHLLRAFTQADCLICIPAGIGLIAENENVDVMILS